MDANTLFKAIIGELNISASSADVKTFFPQVFAKSFENGVLYLVCKSHIVKERIETRYYNQIKNIAEKIVKEKVEISLSVGALEIPMEEESSPAETAPLFKATAKENGESLNKKRNSAGLLDKYSFEQFIVGPNNQFAHTVAKTVAENPGKSYNPLCIYAGVGLGKTHLIQAIGNDVLEKHPELKVLYSTGENFTNELVEAIRSSKSQAGIMTRFKEKYRKVDVLIVDDIQFIAGKEATQEEFFHAFNTLFMAGKQVIITSDKHPNEIKKFEKRLSSRLVMGMVADLQMPDSTFRSALLREKRDTLKWNVSDKVCDTVAQLSETNIRELEGIFTQTVEKIKARQMEMTAESVLSVMGKESKVKVVNPTEILKAVSSLYNIKMSDIKGERRLKEIVEARQVAVFLTRTLTKLSYTDVGNFFGGRDHSTIIHSVEKIGAELKEGGELVGKIEQLKKELGAE